MIEVGNRLGQPPFRERQPSAVDEGLGIIRVSSESAVHLDALGLSPRPRFENFARDPHGPREGDNIGSGSGRARVGRGKGWGLPIQPQRDEVIANSPQIPNKNGLLRGTSGQLRAVGTKGQRRGIDRLQCCQSHDLTTGRGVCQQYLVEGDPQGHQPAVASEHRSDQPPP